MDDPNGPDDEITIDPFPAVRVPEWLAGGGRRLTRRGRFLAAVAGVIVAGAVLGTLKLTGVIWTSAPPAWESALGPGVTVTGPGPVAPGHGSPGAALIGLMDALAAKNPAAVCGYIFLDPAARCAPVNRTPHDKLPYGVSVKVGYVAIDGRRALVGFTGEICSPGGTPRCLTNADPAAVFSAGKTFAALWAQTFNPNASSTPYTLLPCAEVGGKWYYGTGPAASGS